ncbi:hypothetical protein HRbin36_01151 [bacterium HR36]|nr:hypothetical protein HRbin36_01151 [bacterium HR36]
MLKNDPQVPPLHWNIAHRLPIKIDFPTIGLQKPRNQAEQSSLAAPRRSQKEKQLAAAKFQGDVIHHEQRTESFAHVYQPHGRHTFPFTVSPGADPRYSDTSAG